MKTYTITEEQHVRIGKALAAGHGALAAWVEIADEEDLRDEDNQALDDMKSAFECLVALTPVEGN